MYYVFLCQKIPENRFIIFNFTDSVQNEIIIFVVIKIRTK